MKKDIKSADIGTKSPAIIGVFEGECADSNITNKNGMDITRPVWENVFNSEEYKEAIKLGHYIGFLGHPEDPGCMDFEHACIVMTEGHIDSDGKVYGKFNLIDTPVGRIVKTFIDAGVTFGISVRGAGDVIDNSVDPETFVFRGFDIVTFPAFPESIPKFTDIAASSDKKLQQKYKKICSAVSKNIDGLNTIDSINIIQSCFAKQSDTYKELENKKAIFEEENIDEDIEDDERLYAVTDLYLAELNKNKKLVAENARLKASLRSIQSANRRKIDSMNRIYSSQIDTLKQESKKSRITASRRLQNVQKELEDVKSKYNRIVEDNMTNKEAVSQLRKDMITSSTTLENDKATIQKLRKELSDIKGKYEDSITACEDLKLQVNSLKNDNLKYKRRVESSETSIEDQKAIISDLEANLNETVSKIEASQDHTSNLDATNKKLEQKIEAAETLIQEYQDAYANMYTAALGVSPKELVVTASTSVHDLQEMISASRLKALPTSNTVDVIGVTNDVLFDDDADDTLVTM